MGRPSRGRLWPAAGLAALAIVLAALWWYPPLSQPAYAPLSAEAFLGSRLQPSDSLKPGDSRQTSDNRQAGDKVNVNTASLEELTVLPGIGEKRAADIIARREADGPFQSPEDLLAVSGIGPKTLEALEGLIEF